MGIFEKQEGGYEAHASYLSSNRGGRFSDLHHHEKLHQIIIRHILKQFIHINRNTHEMFTGADNSSLFFFFNRKFQTTNGRLI